jgi:hypothetical protein
VTLLADGAAAPANGDGATSQTTNQGATDGTANGASPHSGDGSRWTVPEAYRTQEAVRKFMDDKHTLDPEVVIRSHVELESKLGRDKIVVPKDNATETERREFFAKIGCPAQPEAYTYKAPDKLPDGVTFNPETEKFWRNIAHQNGVTDAQFKALAPAFLEMQANSVAAWNAAQQEATGKITHDLKREWGANFDGNLQQVKAVIAQYAEPDFKEFLNATGLGNDPRMAKLLHKLAGEFVFGDSNAKGGGADSGAGPASRVELQAQITKFDSENWKALRDNMHVDHKRLVAERSRLFEKMHMAAQ